MLYSNSVVSNESYQRAIDACKNYLANETIEKEYTQDTLHLTPVTKRCLSSPHLSPLNMSLIRQSSSTSSENLATQNFPLSESPPLHNSPMPPHYLMPNQYDLQTELYELMRKINIIMKGHITNIKNTDPNHFITRTWKDLQYSDYHDVEDIDEKIITCITISKYSKQCLNQPVINNLEKMCLQ